MIALLQEMLGPHFVQSLGLTFIHSLWQATLIAGILYLILQNIDTTSAKIRYRIAGISLLAVLVSSLITFIYYIGLPQVGTQADSIYYLSESEMILATAQAQSSFFTDWQAYLQPAFPAIIFCWVIGLVLYSGRLVWGGFAIHRLKQSGFPIQHRFQHILNERAKDIGLKVQIPCRVTNSISIPMVLGCLKPVILFPIAMLNQLSIKEVESIMVHELAHIKRLDFIQNIVQSVIESIFYYHPAVWYMSNMIRKERENCCDDVVVEICGNSLDYAKALLQVQNNNLTPLPAMAIPLFSKKKLLLNRIQRILNQPIQKSNIMEKIMVTSMCLLCFILLTLGSSFQAQTPVERGSEKATTIEKEAPESEINLAEMPFATGIRSENRTAQVAEAIGFESEDAEWATVAEISGSKSEGMPMYEVYDLAGFADTIPVKSDSKSILKIKKHTDNELIELQMKDGEVQALTIDGKEIPASDFDIYADKIELMVEQSTVREQPRARGFARPRIAQRQAPPTPPVPPSLEELDAPEKRAAYKLERENYLKEVETYREKRTEGNAKVRGQARSFQRVHPIHKNQNPDTDVFIRKGTDGDHDRIILRGNAKMEFEDGKWNYFADSMVSYDHLNNSFEHLYDLDDHLKFEFKDQNYNLDSNSWNSLFGTKDLLDSIYSFHRSGEDYDHLIQNIYGQDSSSNFFRFDGEGQSHELMQKYFDEARGQFEFRELKDGEQFRFFNDAHGNHFEFDGEQNLLKLRDQDKDFEFHSSGRNYKRSHPFHSEDSEENTIINKLLMEGLIDSEMGYTVILTQKRLKINGEKMPSTIHSKYMKLYESLKGKVLGSKDKVTITHKSSVKF